MFIRIYSLDKNAFVGGGGGGDVNEKMLNRQDARNRGKNIFGGLLLNELSHLLRMSPVDDPGDLNGGGGVHHTRARVGIFVGIPYANSHETKHKELINNE